MGCNLCDDCGNCPHGSVMECDTDWDPSKQIDYDGYDDWYDMQVFLEEQKHDEYEREYGSVQLSHGEIMWHDAGSHIGEKVTVCGAVKSTYYDKEKHERRLERELERVKWSTRFYPEMPVTPVTISEAPTHITIGANYPDPKRVQIIIWSQNRTNFPTPPETLYSGKTICVTGTLYLYKDVVHVEVGNPSQMRIVKEHY